MIKQLNKKFGDIPNELIKQIEAITDRDIIDEVAMQVLFLDSLDKLTIPETA